MEEGGELNGRLENHMNPGQHTGLAHVLKRRDNVALGR